VLPRSDRHWLVEQRDSGWVTRLLEMAPLNQEVHLLLVAPRGRLGRESRLAPMAPQGQPVREGPVAPLGQPVREGWRRQRTVLPSV
jgi:hypothetical protein